MLLILMMAFLMPSNAEIPRTMYVINESAETLTKMNLDNYAIQTNFVATGQVPNQIAIHNKMIYVINSISDNIMVINPKNDNQIEQTIALPEGSNPWAIGFASDQKAYVTNSLANTVAVVDLNAGSMIDEIEVGTHGLYIVRGRKRGLLLPQVAADRNWNRNTFLEPTCMKAGLPPDTWDKEGTKIYIFSADVF